MDMKAQLEMQRRYASGDFTKEPDPRDEIQTMPKGEVRELLVAHGITPEGSVREMRKALTRVMFLEA